jgi:hypothetical protein
MNNITISVASNPTINSLDSVRTFGIFLTKTLATIKMTHWFVDDYNSHVVIGDLYNTLDELFDKFEEEVIGTVKQQNKTFPVLSPNVFDIYNVSNYNPSNGTVLETFNKTCQIILATFTSSEINSFIENTISGLNNTKEEIISGINKANYLLSLIKL